MGHTARSDLGELLSGMLEVEYVRAESRLESFVLDCVYNDVRILMKSVDLQLFTSEPPGYDFNQGVGSYDFSVMSRHEEFVPIWYAEAAKPTHVQSSLRWTG